MAWRPHLTARSWWPWCLAVRFILRRRYATKLIKSSAARPAGPPTRRKVGVQPGVFSSGFLPGRAAGAGATVEGTGTRKGRGIVPNVMRSKSSDIFKSPTGIILNSYDLSIIERLKCNCMENYTSWQIKSHGNIFSDRYAACPCAKANRRG